MTAFQIHIDDADVTRALGKLTERMRDMTDVMEDIGRALGNITEDAFQDERSPFGPAWFDLRPATKARRAKAGHWPGQILQVTGGSGLAGSITHGGDKTSAFVGASKVYAAIHQFGGTSGMKPGPGAIPPRPFIPVAPDGELAPDAQAEVLDLLSDYLTAALRS